MNHFNKNFAILKWDTSNPESSANFLDLPLTIKGRIIVTITYQKQRPNNPYLYLYIPPHSAYPSRMIFCREGKKTTLYSCSHSYSFRFFFSWWYPKTPQLWSRFLILHAKDSSSYLCEQTFRYIFKYSVLLSISKAKWCYLLLDFTSLFYGWPDSEDHRNRNTTTSVLVCLVIQSALELHLHQLL